MTKADLKRHLISFLNTFIPTFFLVLGTQLEGLDFETLTTSTVLAILVSAARAAWKVVFEKWIAKTI